MNTDQFDVTLVGFPGGTQSGEPPIEAMQRLFNIDRPTASRFVSSAPVTVKHDATAREAQLYRQSLQAIGAQVEVSTVCRSRPPGPPTRKVSSVPPPPLSGVGVMSTPIPTPLPRRPSRPAAPAETSQDPASGFFAALPGCFLFPFKGHGKWWMVVTAGMTMVTGVFSIFAGLVPLLGIALNVLMLAGLLTLCARYFQACMASTASEAEAPASLPDLGSFFADFMLPGLSLTAWFIVAHLPFIFWAGGSAGGADPASFIFNPITLLLLLLPAAVWPMALARSAATGSFFSIWNIPRIFLAIARAPFKYAVVLVVGFVATMFPIVLGQLFAVGGGAIFLFASAFFGAAAMAYSHAVMGSMMGHLAKDSPEAVAD